MPKCMMPWLRQARPRIRPARRATAMSQDSLATKADIARLERDLTILKWMLALVIAATVISLIRDLLT